MIEKRHLPEATTSADKNKTTYDEFFLKIGPIIVFNGIHMITPVELRIIPAKKKYGLVL